MVTASAFGQVYKWVDERGVTHYGERPPQDRSATAVPNRLASPAPGGSAAKGASPPKNPGPSQRTAPTEESDSRRSQTGAEKPEDKQREEAARRQEQCNQQRELLNRLRQSPPGFTLGKKGERVQADNAEAIARQEKLAAEQCRG